MKTHLLKKLSLFIGLAGALFVPLHADPEEETRSVEELRWAVEQLTVIIQRLQEENRQLQEQAVQRQREVVRLQQQRTGRFLLGSDLFDEIFN